jgi:hypothetical protein
VGCGIVHGTSYSTQVCPKGVASISCISSIQKHKMLRIVTFEDDAA